MTVSGTSGHTVNPYKIDYLPTILDTLLWLEARLGLEP